MLSKIAKFGISTGWKIIMGVIVAELSKITQPVLRKLADNFVYAGNKTVAILTNNNPDDSGEFAALLQEQKQVAAVIGLEAAKDLVVNKIPDPNLQALVNTTLEQVLEALRTGTFNEAALVDSLQADEPANPK